MPHPREVIRADRVRTIPESFSWIDRQLLHGGHLEKLTTEEIALYFFLVLVSGPEGTSYWGYSSIARLLKLPEEDLVHATAGLVKKGLVAFRYPTFQVLSLPPAEVKRSGRA
jgi:NADPH-dependent curcumin reductase CurA